MVHCYRTAGPVALFRSKPLIGFFLPIAEAIAAGYLAVILTYAGVMFCVTRMGRKLLMSGDCVSVLYTVLLCLTWFAASLAGAYFCCGMSPLPPYGPVILPVVLAVFCGMLVRRNTVQLPGQQSPLATLGIGLMIVAGTSGALYLRHAL